MNTTIAAPAEPPVGTLVDLDGQWVGLDGEMTLSVRVPFFTIRRVTAAAQREAQ